MVDSVDIEGEHVHVSILEFVEHARAELKWSREETWDRLDKVAKRRGLPVISVVIERPNGEKTFTYGVVDRINASERRAVPLAESLRILREEFPRAAGSRRGPKERYDWDKARSALEAFWMKNGGPAETQADDERFVLEWFSNQGEQEPGEVAVRTKVRGWRDAWKQGH